MKYWIWGIVLCAYCTGAWADGAYRDFTNKQGQSVRGRVLSVDSRKNTVTIELENKRKTKVPVTGFSEDDQQYIHTWMVLEGVRSESKFKISCERRKVKSWTEKHYGSVTAGGESEGTQVTGKSRHEEAGFDVVLSSRNECSIRGLTLEYCIHYEQEVRRNQAAQKGVLYKSISIGEIAEYGKKTISTDSVSVFEYEKGEQFVGTFALNGEINGILLRLYLAANGEKILVREAAYPANLSSSYPWVTASRPVGKN